MARKKTYSQSTITKQNSKTLSQQIESILKLYKNDRQKARQLIEEQARRVWLQYLYQEHTEVTVTCEVEKVEERQQLIGGGNPDAEVITTRTTTKTTTKTTTPKTPLWAIKAGLSFGWEVNKKFEELEALNLCVEAGLMPESTKDAVVDFTNGFASKVLESKVLSNEVLNDDVPLSETME